VIVTSSIKSKIPQLLFNDSNNSTNRGPATMNVDNFREESLPVNPGILIFKIEQTFFDYIFLSFFI